VLRLKAVFAGKDKSAFALTAGQYPDFSKYSAKAHNPKSSFSKISPKQMHSMTFLKRTL